MNFALGEYIIIRYDSLGLLLAYSVESYVIKLASSVKDDKEISA